MRPRVPVVSKFLSQRYFNGKPQCYTLLGKGEAAKPKSKKTFVLLKTVSVFCIVSVKLEYVYISLYLDEKV